MQLSTRNTFTKSSMRNRWGNHEKTILLRPAGGDTCCCVTCGRTGKEKGMQFFLVIQQTNKNLEGEGCEAGKHTGPDREVAEESMEKLQVKLAMKRGRRLVLIGLFPSIYRAEVVADALGWDSSWKPVIEKM